MTNKNVIPYDPESPMITSGLRFGSPALTTRRMKEAEMEQIAEIVHKALSNPHDESFLKQLQEQVGALCKAFPIYQDL